MRFLRDVAAHSRDPLYRNGYFLMLNSITGAVFGFVFWIVVARAFHDDASAVGYGAAVVSSMTLVALVAKLGFDAALIRYVPRSGRAGRIALLACASSAAAAGAVVVALAFLALVPTLVPDLRGLRGDPIAGFLFATGAAAIALGWILDAYFVAERRASLSLLRNLVLNVVKLALPMLALFHASALGIPAAWAAGVAASVAVGAVLAAALAKRAARAGQATPSRSELLRYASFNAATTVADFLPGLALPILVLHVAGAEANAYFYVAWSVAFVAFLASKSIATSAFAEISHDAIGATSHIRKAVRQNVLVLAAFGIGVLALGKPALALFGPAYVDRAWPLLLVLAASAPFVAGSALYVTLLKARGAGWELVLLPVATLALTFAAGAPLLASHGLVGLGVGWLAANVIVAAYSVAGLVARVKRLEPHDVAQPVGGPAH